MKIGVIGGGIVGAATARSFVEHGDVFVYDTKQELRTDTYEATVDSDIVFVCLPTPQRYDTGLLCTRYVDEFFAGVAGAETAFVLKSTVPVGTTDRLREQFKLPNLVHSPEFLTARCANTDAQIPARNIVGGPQCEGKKMLVQLLWERFPGVQVLEVSAMESEVAKLICNSFFAVKIAFFNEVFEYAQLLGLNWRAVQECVLSDGRISHAHTRVPGPNGQLGFGGACLPKDLSSFVAEQEMRGLRPYITGAAIDRNAYDRSRNNDLRA